MISRRAFMQTSAASSLALGSLKAATSLNEAQNQASWIDAHVHVWTPDSLTEEQSRLFRELAVHEGEPPSRSGGLWSKIKEVLGA